MNAQMTRKPTSAGSFDLRATLAVFLATCLAFPASAATSFPDYPLQTGVASVPPNIMFILDNSGSMGLISMPTTSEDFDVQPVGYSGTATGASRTGLRDNPHDRSYLNNAIYYDPGTDYQPWLTADGNTRMTGGQSASSAYTHWSLADGSSLPNGGSGTLDLRGSSESVFYVPNDGVTQSTDASDFTRYRISTSGKVVKSGNPTRMSGFPRGPLSSNMNAYTERTFTVSVPSGIEAIQVSTSGGGRNVELNVLDPNGDRVCRSNSGNGGEHCAASEPRAGSWTLQVYRDNSGTFSNVSLDVFLVAEVEATPTGRTQAEELENFATWYSYFRTRMKTAKAGASEAFAGLSRNYRVGYTPINGRSSHLSANGTSPIIPVNSNDGLFETTNKSSWFSSVHDAETQNGSTPLRTALNAVGQYYLREDANGPWGPQATENQLTCRQNFAILTTDGYWNDNSNTDFGLNDVDGDGHQVTLADVAANYYNVDLRDGMEDNVPVSASDAADWQHLVTFGISIGLRGTLTPSIPPPTSWPDPMDREDAHRIDDLYHASVNGRGSFIAAANANEFAAALKAALATISKRRSSGSNVTSNGPQLNAGSRIFQATFTSGEWSGDVQSVSLASGGGIGTSSWSLADVIGDDAASFLSRGVYTWDRNESDGAAFPTAAQMAALERTGGAAPVTGADNADYIKGDRSREGGAGRLRARTTPIGDIVNSSPFFSEEAAALFIGANDGMLHGINSATGAVEFSYVPAGLNFQRLSTLSDPEYQHHFFVDGGMDVSTRAQGGNRNILVASLGRGGKGVFALDVSDPSTFDDTDVLWDGTTTTDADMGYVLGAPLVRRGRTTGSSVATYAFVGNGIESANGSSTLFVYNAVSGALIRKIVVDANGGGLASPRAADINLDGVADTIYAGDLSGSLWRFDISGNINQWSFERMFAAVDGAGNAQPITAPVAIAREPVTERIFVSFGTGRYISVDDLPNQSTQTMYALVDDGTAISGRASLQQRTIPRTGVDAQGRPARSWEGYSPLPEDAQGWFIDLGIPTAGERVVTGPFLRGRALWFSSIIPQPGSGCDAGGSGYLNAIDAFTGTSPQFGSSTGTFMDVDGDGEGDDKLGGDNGAGDDGFVGSIDLGLGMVGQGTGVGNGVYACGSEAECGYVPTPPDSSGARRLGWRELFNRN